MITSSIFKHPYALYKYANVLSSSEHILALSSANTHVLLRDISNTRHQDAIGVYPRCAITQEVNWLADFAFLNNKIVSLVFVADIFYAPPHEKMAVFFDHVQKFKRHYLLNREKPIQYNKHHRYEVKQANKACRIQEVSLQDYLPQWNALYQALIDKHQITGVQCFSERYFQALSVFPELITFAAFDEQNKLLAMHLWLAYENVLYSHLAASSTAGYQKRAAYAIYDHIISQVTQYARIDFGGAAGIDDDANNGLARFKRGFANEEQCCYLYGKIFNHKVYQDLCVQAGRTALTNQFFPAYRAP